MKKISVQKIKKELANIGADNATTDLIMNSISMYNDLVAKYLNGTIGRDIYLMYQLNGLVVKQLTDIRKANKKTSGEDEDTFTAMIDSFKK
jgi:hypothetical protein